jgi:histone H3/H4
MLTKAVIKRIANIAGATRVGGSLYNEVNSLYNKVLEAVLEACFHITMSSGYQANHRKTVVLGDLKEALKIMKVENILFNPHQRKYPIPLAGFRRDVKKITSDLINPTQWKPRFTAEVINGLRGFVGHYLFRYLRSAVGLKGHCGLQTLDERDLKNIHTVCVEFPKNLVKPSGIPNVEATLPKKKKKKKKKSLKRYSSSGTELGE